MAEGSSSTTAAAAPPAAPPPRAAGAAPAAAGQAGAVRGRGLGLALALPAASPPRVVVPSLSYARNFDLGRDADAARIYYACSFSSRFALVPAAASSSAVVGAGAAPAGLPVAATS